MTDSRKIIVIGLDGATWDILGPRMASGSMPNLQRLAAKGASGNLRSIFPPETPAAWPSFMTGKNPGKHGAFDFLVYDPETGTERPVNARLRKGKTIWDYLTAAGKTSLVLNVPTTYPPTPIQGALISDFLTPAGARDYTYPPELAAELEREMGRYPLFFETMSFVCASSEYNAGIFLDELERMDTAKFDVAEKLFDRYQPDFTMLHIWGTDRLQHELWHWYNPDHPKYDRAMAEKFGPRIEAYYTMIDERVGRLAAKAGEDGVTFVISDHGFGGTNYFIDQNSWLLREGFIALKSSFRVKLKKFLFDLGVTPHNATRVFAPILRFLSYVKAAAPETTLRKSTGAISLPGMLGLSDVDWTRTQAYAPFGWSGIYINTKGIRPHGSVDPKDYESIRDRIVQRWKQLENPRTGQLVGGPIHTNSEMFNGPFSQYGPDIMALPLDEHYMPVCFFGFASKEPVYENVTLYGNHRMEGILIANGKGIRPGTVTGASLMDMAPTLLHLLGHPVPSDMDGKVLTALIESQGLDSAPVQHVEAQEDSAEYNDGLSEAEEEEIRAKLMGLGYL
ncbi:MAG: alkaline phosphatase family protein [Candidatus Hydrogenedentes bacterium]|nr:alkaline phosphatase family protein [Candidatus Hydrogenedentota bacterium]